MRPALWQQYFYFTFALPAFNYKILHFCYDNLKVLPEQMVNSFAGWVVCLPMRLTCKVDHYQQKQKVYQMYPLYYGARKLGIMLQCVISFTDNISAGVTPSGTTKTLVFLISVNYAFTCAKSLCNTSVKVAGFFPVNCNTSDVT